MQKMRIQKEDGRYLIYYSFDTPNEGLGDGDAQGEEGEDCVGVEMEPDSRGVGGDRHP